VAQASLVENFALGSVPRDPEGAPSFAFFAKGGNRSRIGWSGDRVIWKPADGWPRLP